MMYRRDILPPTPPQRHHRIPWKPLLVAFAVAAGVGGIYGFISLGLTGRVETLEAALPEHRKEDGVEVTRLRRDQIPRLDFDTVHCHQLFNDLQDVQEAAARRNGLKDPARLGDPSQCSDLVLVQSCDLYVVDTLYHSKPYLVPAAALVLQMIGERFQEILSEQYPGKAYRPIVTSVLRSHNDVSRLRRVNRNATENSCHLYGTTVDISYTRYRLTDHTDTVDHNELYLKNILSQTLYELRYEGLIYVKYERIGCYHLTLRASQYLGTLPSETRRYPILLPHPTQHTTQHSLSPTIQHPSNTSSTPTTTSAHTNYVQI